MELAASSSPSKHRRCVFPCASVAQRSSLDSTALRSLISYLFCVFATQLSDKQSNHYKKDFRLVTPNTIVL